MKLALKIAVAWYALDALASHVVAGVFDPITCDLWQRIALAIH